SLATSPQASRLASPSSSPSSPPPSSSSSQPSPIAPNPRERGRCASLQHLRTTRARILLISRAPAGGTASALPRGDNRDAEGKAGQHVHRALGVHVPFRQGG